jgi:hypothetical protein
MKPILFNTEMVRATLDGRKTTTRRVIKPQPEQFGKAFAYKDGIYSTNGLAKSAPFQKGDILYVRETFCSAYDGEAYFYFADKCTSREKKKLLDYNDVRWRPSIQMPKEAARIFLRVTDVRAERLQDMTENEVKKEGYPFSEITGDKLDDFAILWNSTVKHSDRCKYGWNANPWVWVIEFERCEKPEEEK